MFIDSEKYFEQLVPYELLVGTVFPAPPAINPMPEISSINLDEIVESLDVDELCRIANTYLRRGELKLSEKYFALIQRKKADLYQVIAVRGLVLLFLGDIKKSESLLKKALLKEPLSGQINLWLAFVLIKQNKLKTIQKYLNVALDSKDRNIQSLALFLKHFVDLKKKKFKDARYSIEALQEFKEFAHIRQLLVSHKFLMGKEEFEKGQLIEACNIWAEAFRVFQTEWIKDPRINIFFQKLCNKKLHFLSIRQNKNRFPDLAFEKLIHLNLIPEFFENPSSLSERKAYWKSQVDREGTYPYAYFRYGLCQVYLNELADAYETFLICRDKIPASKVSFFKIDQIIDWLRDLLHAERIGSNITEVEDKLSQFSSDTNVTSNGWQNYFLTEAEALEWIEQQFSDPSTAKRWANLGAKASEAKLWSSVFKGNDSLAYTFFAAGFRDPEVALQWSRRFSVPVEAWECYKEEIEKSNVS